MPFGEYENFEECVRENQEKDDPEAYCAEIKRKIEGDEEDGMKEEKDITLCSKLKKYVDAQVEAMPIITQEEIISSTEKVISMNGVLKVPVTMAAEMVQHYSKKKELPWMKDFVPEDVEYIPVFKPFDELVKMIQAIDVDYIPFVIPHTKQTFLESQCPEDIRPFLDEFIPKERVLGKVRDFSIDFEKKKVKAWIYINEAKLEETNPGLADRMKSGHVIDVSIGFMCEFGGSGVYEYEDWGYKEEYLLHQKNMILGHLAGLPHDVGKCPSGICGINQDKQEKHIDHEHTEKRIQSSEVVINRDAFTRDNYPLSLESIISHIKSEGTGGTSSEENDRRKNGLKSESGEININGGPIMTPEEAKKLLEKVQRLQAENDTMKTELQNHKDSNYKAMADQLQEANTKIGILTGELKKVQDSLSDANKKLETYKQNDMKKVDEELKSLNITNIFVGLDSKPVADATLEEKVAYLNIRKQTLDALIKDGKGFPMPGNKDREIKTTPQPPAATEMADAEKFPTMQIYANKLEPNGVLKGDGK